MVLATLSLTVLLAAGFGATPPAPGAPRFVQLLSVEGLPADSSAREAFGSGLRGAFAEERLASERLGDDGAWHPADPVGNRFRLLEGFPADDAWTMQITIGAPARATANRRKPHSREIAHSVIVGKTRSRGMTLALLVRSPEAIRNDTPAVAERVDFAFPAPASESGDRFAFTGRGYDFPWEAAGRAAALLALDTLHHRTAELSDHERFSLSPAVRASDATTAEE